MFIYLIVNRVTGKYYVGQHKGTNLRKYLQDKFSQAWYELKRGRGGSSHLFNSMRKHPKEAWAIHALLSDVQTREELNQWEQFFIALFKSRDPLYGYNICQGGEGFSGPHSQVAREKIAAASREMWQRSEIRENFSGKMRGHPAYPNAVAAVISRNKQGPTEVTREKLKAVHTGVSRRFESRDKQRKSVTGTNNHFYGKTHSEETLAQIRKPVRCVTTGDVFPSLLQAAQWAGWAGGGSGNLSRALKGKGNFLGKCFEYVQQLSEPTIGDMHESK